MQNRNVLLSILFILTLSYDVPGADDPARGHFESALLFLQSNKAQQAIEDLKTIIQSFPQSPYADDALLQMGLYHFRENRQEEALSFFQQIKERYAGADAAPAAYYYMGEIYVSRLDPASLEVALANFQRVTRVYPSSQWVDEALVGSGVVWKVRGEYDKAYDEFARVQIRFPQSQVAARAQYEMGICSLYTDQFLEAASHFQQVLHRYPNSEYAAPAINMNTILYRLYIASRSEKKLYAPNSSFSATIMDLDEPTGLAVDSKQNVYLSDKGKKTVHVFDSSGKSATSYSMPSPYFISVDSQDRVLVANGTSVSWLNKESLSFQNPEGKPEPMEEIRSSAVNGSGQYLVISNKHRGIYVFAPDKALIPGFSFSSTEKEYYKVLINSRNQICVLDKDRKQISVYSPDGKLLFTMGPSGNGYAFERIEDFAVDPANNFYLLEKSPRGVLIFSPSGELLRSILSQKKTEVSFEDSKVIAVGPSGAIYLVDKDTHRILKLG